MTLDEYQLAAGKTNKGTALFVLRDDGTYEQIPALYNVLAMNGESGEAAEKLKKLVRSVVTNYEAHREAMLKELGDVLWYVSQAAHDFGFTLDEVANANLKKLRDRAARSVLAGSGDNR